MKVSSEDGAVSASKHNFDVQEFQKCLRDETNSLKAIKHFIKSAKDPACIDVVHLYLQEAESAYGTELLRLITKDKSSVEVIKVFQALELIFLRIADDLKNYVAWGITVTKRLMESPAEKIIQNLLSVTNSPKEIKRTLNLLTSMVAISPASASVVAHCLKFSSILQLLSKTDLQTSTDLRMCAIHLILSFLICNDMPAIWKIVEKKGLVNSIFPGLIYDRLSTIQMVLRTLLSQVVENRSLTKSIKIKLFNNFSLNIIFKLLQWTGPKNVPKNRDNKKRTNFEKKVDKRSIHATEIKDNSVMVSEDVEAVQNLAHDFLLGLCSPKRGIIYVDKTAGTSKKNYNHIIRSLLLSVKEPYKHPLVESTIIDILKACPDQVPRYIPFLTKLEIEPTVEWFQTMSFVIKILKSYDVISVLRCIDKKTPPRKVASIIWQLFIMFNNGKLLATLKHECFRIRNTGLCYLEVLLHQATHIFTNFKEELLLWTSLDLTLFKNNLKQELVTYFPKLTDLKRHWDSAIQNTQLFMEYIDNNDTHFLSSSHEPLAHFKLLLNVITMHIQLFPPTSEQSGILLGLLNGIEVLETRVDESHFYELLVSILTTIGNNCGHSILSLKVGCKTVLHRLCETFHYTSNAGVKVSENILKQLLMATELLSSNEAEIDMWLHTFLSNADDKLAAEFFESVAIEFITNPQLYIDITYKNFLQSNSLTNSDKTANDISDAILVESDFVDSSNLQFTPMVIVALDKLKLMRTKNEDVCQKVTAVLYNLLHCQYIPEVFCQVIHQYKKSIPKSFRNYVKLFNLSSQDYVTGYSRNPSGIVGKSAEEILRITFEMKTPHIDVSPEYWEGLFSKVSQEEIPQLTRQLLSYLNILLKSKNKSEFSELVMFYCKHLNSLLDVKRDYKCFENRSCHQHDAFQVEIRKIILSHPIIQTSFLHEDLIHKLDEAKSSLILTRLAFELLGGMKNFQQENYYCSYRNKMESFILSAVHFLLIEQSSNFKELYSLIADLDPYLPFLTLGRFYSLIDEFFQVPLNSLVKLKKKEMPLTCLGKLFIRILNLTTSIFSSSNPLTLSTIQVHHCCDIYVQLKDNVHAENMNDTSAKYQIGIALCSLVERNCFYALLFKEDIFLYCLEDCATFVSQKLAVMLLQRNANFISPFENWFIQKSLRSEFILDYIPVILTYLDEIRLHFPFICENRNPALKCIANVCWPFILTIAFKKQNPNLEMACGLLCRFLELDIIEMPNIVNLRNLMTEYMNSDLCHPPSLLLASRKIFQIFPTGHEIVNDIDPRTAFIILCLKTIFSCAKIDIDSNVMDDQQFNLIDFVTETLVDNFISPNLGQMLHKLKLWHIFMKSSLKIGLINENGSRMLYLLKILINRLYENKEFLPLHASTMFGLIVGHSRFLPGLLDVSVSNCPWRERILDLMLLLIKFDPSICNKDHIPIYLASYRASLAPTDQKLLKLIYYYEKYGVKLDDFMPFIFGKNAIEYYSIFKKLKYGLWRKLSPNEIIRMLDEKMLLNTALKFPLEMQPRMEDQSDFVVASDLSEKMYDPRFILPLFAHLISPESAFNYSTFVKCNGLALVIATLSSTSGNMRAMGYHILSNYYHHLKVSKLPLASRLLYFLDIIRNAVKGKNAMLPNIIGVFLIRACSLLTDVSDMSKHVIRFLLLNPILDIHSVPNFIASFYNLEKMVDFKCRSWILSVIQEGLRAPIDYNICTRRNMFEIIFSAIQAPTRKQHILQLEVLKILISAVKLPSVAFDLCNNYGVLVVINEMVKSRTDDDILNEAVNVLYTSWNSLAREEKTNEGLRNNDLGSNAFSPMTNTVHPCPTLSKILVAEFFLTLVTLLQRLSEDAPLNTFNQCASILASLLKWSQRNLKDFDIPRMNCSLISRLVYLYRHIVEKVFPNVDVLATEGLQNYPHSRLDDTFKDPGDLILSKSCQKSICEIFLCWNCFSLVDNITESSFAEICAVFTSVSSHLLKSLLPLQNNFYQMRQVYSWLSNHLQTIRLTEGLLRLRIDTGDILSYIFKTYEHLLTMNESGKTVVGDSINNYSLMKAGVIVELCKVFVLLLKNVDVLGVSNANDSFFKSLEMEQSSLTWFSFQRLHRMLNTPVLRHLLIELHNNDESDVQAQAAIKISFLACEVWMTKQEEPDNFEENFQNLSQKYFKNCMKPELMDELSISYKRQLNDNCKPLQSKKKKK